MQIFRRVADKGYAEHLSDAPNAASFLDELSEKIIDGQVTTGDELVDALVAWYGGSLAKETIDRFHKLDTGLAGMLGQLALVVSRTRSHRKPFKIGVNYGVGVINGEGLVVDIIRGEAYIPTEGRVSIGGIQRAVQERCSLLVTRIFACGYDDEYRFLAYGTPNLAKRHTVDGRVDEAFEPDDYATRLDANESRQPHVQVIVGTDNVRGFLSSNESAVSQFSNPETVELLENLLTSTAA